MATKVAESSEYSNYFPNKSFQKTFVCLFLYNNVKVRQTSNPSTPNPRFFLDE